MHHYSPGNTVSALATPPGTAGVSIVRMSGDLSIAIAEKMFSGNVSSYMSHRAYFGKILDDQGDLLDEGLLILFLAPASYTGENSVEFHCHGSPFIVQRILDTTYELGAAPALPGEFTYRAFYHGKIDLAQAEAVHDIVMARHERAHEAAQRQLQGKLSEEILAIQRILIEVMAQMEAAIDFPDENLSTVGPTQLQKRLDDMKDRMHRLCESFRLGERFRHGFSICLIGEPNVGKSSLLNRMTGEEHALVTQFPGTTRDRIRGEFQVHGMPFFITDTAGNRETNDPVERAGIERGKEAAQSADLILRVVDVTMPPSKRVGESSEWLIWNKLDKGPVPPNKKEGGNQEYGVSARTGEGISELKEAIYEALCAGRFSEKEEIVLTHRRHYESLKEAIEHVARVPQAPSAEYAVSDIRSALESLNRILGIAISESMLSDLFSRFCVGK
ncbi:MAG: tRNA uridine-5-carboxymethylaminomethyl(34) synthesis GTPase MnmE [Chlamydiota bacterium]|nr:tRNA uridine-5-carboxymethylaminomethyl(34) synthesis GTPase MnmE [Chlamydiota bacterium]